MIIIHLIQLIELIHLIELIQLNSTHYFFTFYQSLPQVDDDDLDFETVNQRKCARSISSCGHCQMFLPPQISNTLQIYK